MNFFSQYGGMISWIASMFFYLATPIALIVIARTLSRSLKPGVTAEQPKQPSAAISVDEFVE